MRRLMLWAVAILVPLVLALLPSASSASAPAAKVKCPVGVGEPTGGNVQWAFTDSSPPSGGTVRSSYVHGLGNWTAGRASGTACTTDSLTSGGGVRDLILGIDGPAKLTGRVYQSGLLGVRMILPIKVTASDDRSCKAGSTGTITLFASYYAVHRDTAQVHFGATCTGHNLSYAGSDLHVYIARDGAQVNSP